MIVSWCRSRWLYDEPHKSEQYFCALFVLLGACARVCVCGGGGCHCHEATRNTLANG